MTKLEKKLRASLRRLGVSEREAILIAVSGGADSTALLDAFVRWRQSRGASGAVCAAHLNHSLRGAESEADEAFVREMAARLNVPLVVERERVAERALKERRNLEAVARRLRYDFLQRAAGAGSAGLIATAHTWDDQAETLLMRWLRGSGPEGLRGIHPALELGPGVKLIRPLLGVTRAEVLAHCEHYHLEFRTDSSNFSPELMRNRVRHELLPLLRTFNPRFGAALIRAAEQMAEDEDYLGRAAAAVVAAGSDGLSLDLRSLRAAHPAVRRRALRLWLRAARGDLRRIEAVHLKALDRLATHGQGGQYVELPGGWQAHRVSKRLILIKAQDARGGTEPLACRRILNAAH
jgi:tRNA(Ile)-lysidine synthase